LKYYFLYIAFFFLLQSAMTQPNSGSVLGSVTDAKTQEVLGGVNVLLRGTVRGTTTNVQGKYQLKRIPAGTYDVIFSLIGYLTDTVHQY
jgi:hypothetical protein